MLNSIAKKFSLLLILMLAFSFCFVACNPETEKKPPVPPEPDNQYGNFADLEKIDSLNGLILKDNWDTTVEKYTVIENNFLTLHPGTTEATLKNFNFEKGVLEFQVKIDMQGDAVCFVLCVQNNKYSDMNYNSGMKNYTISILDDGNVELVKYKGGNIEDEGHEELLVQSDKSADTLLSGANFVNCKIEMNTDESTTTIKFFVGKTVAGKLIYEEYLNYTDKTDAYHGGRFAVSTVNGSGVAITDAQTDASKYVKPELPPFSEIEVKGVPEYEESAPLTMFTGSATKEETEKTFAESWSGRNGVFNYQASEKMHNGKYGITLLPALNEEEGGTTEFVGHYNKYIFSQVMYEIQFSIDKLDSGWIMFWFKLAAETQNVSAWGNKFTREAAQSYMTYLPGNGKLEFNKWVDWQQFFLGEAQNVKKYLDPQDAGIVKTIRMYVEYAKLDPNSEKEYDSVVISMAAVDENGQEHTLRQYQDSSDTALFNPGFFGIQTFSGATLTIYDIKATVLA